MVGIGARIKHAWNAFTNQESDVFTGTSFSYAGNSGSRPDRTRFRITNERSIVASIYTRMCTDAAQVQFEHVRLDQDGRYVEVIQSGLNNCLNVEANIDQAANAFLMDIVWTILNEGVACVVPVDTTLDPTQTGGYDIQTMRVGRILQWGPQQVRVSLYNDQIGLRQEITVPKSICAIIENPFYSVMNEPNSTLQRLIRKLNMLDDVDEQSSSGKLNMIIQLPYTVKTDTKRDQAERRRNDIEFQLTNNKYGIAYADATEKITQLNRPIDNNLLDQVEYLVALLMSQLGLTQDIMDGTAAPTVMASYLGRTIEPILEAIRQELHRKFLTKTARSQRQAIMYFRDFFKIVPIEELADLIDKLVRDEILAANEIRQALGYKPNKDPKSDVPRNPNMPQPDPPTPDTSDSSDDTTDDSSDSTDPSGTQSSSSTDSQSQAIMQKAFDSVDQSLDSIFNSLGVSASGS